MFKRFRLHSCGKLAGLVSVGMLLLLACAEENRSTLPASSVGYLFPHATDIEHGDVHGSLVLNRQNEFSGEACSECHEIFGPGDGNIPSCQSCHENYPHTEQISGPRHGISFLSDSVRLSEACGGCHALDSGDSLGFAPGCQSCHVGYPHTSAISGSRHGLGNSISSSQFQNLCGTCHSVNSTESAGSAPGCKSFHAQYPHESTWEEAQGHGLYMLADFAGRKNNCTSCHGSALEGGGVAQSCTACHTMPDATKVSQHEPLTNSVCGDCHATTTAEIGGDHLLKASPPTLCFDCHSEGSGSKAYEHSVVTEGDACLNCHPAHDSDYQGLLRDNQRQLCFSCHNQELTSATYGTTRNMQMIYEDSSSVHVPFAIGMCTTCHDVHGSNNPHLMATGDSMFWNSASTTDGEIAAYSCMNSGCHANTDIFLVDATYSPGSDDRPDNYYPTQFLRRGSTYNTNLHMIHTQYTDANDYAEITQELHPSCLSCHNPHGNNDPYLMRDFITYSDPGSVYWYFKTGCGGCHVGTWPAGTVDDPAFDPW